MVKRIQAVFVIIFVYTAIFFGNAKAAISAKTAELVPEDTIILININNFNSIRTKFEKSSTYGLFKDPSMAAFTGSLKKKYNENILKESDPILKAILDTNCVPEGKLAIAFVLAEDAFGNQDPPVLLISEWGQNTEKIKESIDKIVSKAIEEGAHRAIEDYRDVNLITLTKEADQVAPPGMDRNLAGGTEQPKPDRFSYCFIDDCFVAGNDIDRVKFVIAKIKGGIGSALSSDPDYIAGMGVAGAYEDMDLYINLKQFIKRMTTRDTTGSTQMMLSSFGLDNVTGLCCSFGFVGDRNELAGKAFLKTVGTRRGVLKMLETRSDAVRLPRFLPSTTYTVSFFNIDVKLVYDELCNVLYSIEPAMAVSLQMPLVEAGAEGEPGVSLRNDILEHLGSELVAAQSLNKPFSTDKMPTDTLFAVSLNNRSALERSLSIVHRKLIMPRNPDSSRELLGHTIYIMSPFGIPFFGGAIPMQLPDSAARPPVARMAFTVTDTHLIFGQEPAVEKAIRTLSGTDSEPLESAKWFSIAKSAVPSVVGMAGFEDNSASGELLWWMLKQSSKTQRASVGAGSTAAIMARPGLWGDMGFDLLPEFETVRKYFGYSALYEITRDDGFLFEFKYINPPGGSDN